MRIGTIEVAVIVPIDWTTTVSSSAINDRADHVRLPQSTSEAKSGRLSPTSSKTKIVGGTAKSRRHSLIGDRPAAFPAPNRGHVCSNFAASEAQEAAVPCLSAPLVAHALIGIWRARRDSNPR